MKIFKSKELEMTRVVKELCHSGRRTEQMFYYIEQGSDFDNDRTISRIVLTFNESLELIKMLQDATKYNHG